MRERPGPCRFTLPVMPSPTDYLRLVLDPVRLAVLGHAAANPVSVETLASALGIDERRVLQAVSVLRSAGLLTADLTLDREALVEVAREMPTVEPTAPAIVDGSWTNDEIEVLSRFFVGSRLKEIPANRSKRLVILERLAQEFEPGLRYDERTVNSILQVFHPDYAALRRYMVDEALLTRADGIYWRSGGRYEPMG